MYIALPCPGHGEIKNYSVGKRIQADFYIKHVLRQMTQNKEPQITLKAFVGLQREIEGQERCECKILCPSSHFFSAVLDHYLYKRQHL